MNTVIPAETGMTRIQKRGQLHAAGPFLLAETGKAQRMKLTRLRSESWANTE